MKQVLNRMKHLQRLLPCLLALSMSLGFPGLQAQPQEELELLHVQGNVYAVFGAGGNTVLQVGDQGVLVVDTKLAGASEALLARIEAVSDAPIRWVVNTHVHPDHIGNNGAIAAAGEDFQEGPAKVYSHLGVVTTLVTTGRRDFEGLPTETFIDGSLELYANGEPVQIEHQPDAHTDGDSAVFFRDSDVLVTGDIFTTTGYPYIDVENGGTIQGILDALNRMLDEYVIPAGNQQGGTLVVPGHGRITDEYELVNYRDMLQIIVDRIDNAIAEGMSLQEVQAAGLTRDYDPRYGSSEGFWTTAQFVEAIYNERSE